MTIYGVGYVWLILMLGCGMPSSARVYTVGDSAGWSLNFDYTTWTSDKTFKVGDTLVFNYGTGHTVDEVSSGNYGTCTVGKSIASYTSGPTTIALNTTGTHYFICGVVGHCSGGMKVAVPVSTGGGAAPAPSGTGGSSSGNPTLTPPTGTGSGSVAASSATISPVVAAAFSLLSFEFMLVLS